jgi:hypothetical protein
MNNRMPSQLSVAYEGWNAEEEVWTVDFPEQVESIELSFFRNQRGQIEVSFRETRLPAPEPSL